MYRIFCESYQNYKSDFSEPCERTDIAKCFELLTDPMRYRAEREAETPLYGEANDLLLFLQGHQEEYPRTSALLWMMAARDIVPKDRQVCETARLREQAKLVTSFMRLTYW